MQVIADFLVYFYRVGKEHGAVKRDEEVGLEEWIERDVITT